MQFGQVSTKASELSAHGFPADMMLDFSEERHGSARQTMRICHDSLLWGRIERRYGVVGDFQRVCLSPGEIL